MGEAARATTDVSGTRWLSGAHSATDEQQRPLACSAPVRAAHGGGDRGIEVDELLAGKYRVEQTVHTGQRTVILSAWHVDLDKRVAIKSLRPEFVGDPEAIEQFRREARATSLIDSEHAVRVYEFAALASGVPYLVTEYLDGHPLTEELLRQTGLPAPGAIHCILQACDAIAEAHARGVCHGGLNLSSLFVARGLGGVESIKVLGFGRLLRPRANPTRETATGSQAPGADNSAPVLEELEIALDGPEWADWGPADDGAGAQASSDCEGEGHPTDEDEPAYEPGPFQPPEHERGSPPNETGDVWALGALLYVLLRGLQPDGPGTRAQLLNASRHGVRAPPGVFDPMPGMQLGAVLSRALSFDPAERWPSVLAFAQALRPLAPRDSGTRTRPPTVQALQTPPPTTGPTATTTPPPVRPRPRPLALLAVLAVASAATLVVMRLATAPIGRNEARLPRHAAVPSASWKAERQTARASAASERSRANSQPAAAAQSAGADRARRKPTKTTGPAGSAGGLPRSARRLPREPAAQGHGRTAPRPTPAPRATAQHLHEPQTRPPTHRHQPSVPTRIDTPRLPLATVPSSAATPSLPSATALPNRSTFGGRR